MHIAIGGVFAFAFHSWDKYVLIPRRENFYRDREAAVRARKAKTPIPQPAPKAQQ